MKGSFLAEKGEYMEFFNSAVGTLQTLVVALGAALCVWGGINLLEGYGQDNPASKSQGVKQLVAGGGCADRYHPDSSSLRSSRLISAGNEAN